MEADKKIERLYKAFREELSPKDRKEAIRSLVKFDGVNKTDLIRECLDDVDDEIVFHGLNMIRWFKPEDIEEMVNIGRLTHHDNTLIRWKVVQILGEATDHSVLNPFLNAVRDDDWQVRSCAIYILGGKVRGLSENPTRDGIHSLIRILASVDRLHDDITNVFRVLPVEHFESLIESINIPSEAVQRCIIEALGEMKERRAVPKLIEFLDSDFESVCVATVRALGMIGDARAIRSLMSQITSCMSTAMFEALTDALVSLGEDAIEVLYEYLRIVKSRQARKLIIRVLGRIGSPRTVKVLIPQLRSSYFGVRSEAIEALIRIGEPSKEELLEILGRRSMPAEIYHKIALESENHVDRTRAIEIIGTLGNYYSLEVLEQISEEKNPYLIETLVEAKRRIRSADSELWGAITALNRIMEGAELFDIIAKYMYDCPTEVRIAAAKCLAGVPEELSFWPLVKLLKDPKREIQYEALRILEDFQGYRKELYKCFLDAYKEKDSSNWVKAKAAACLGKLMDSAAVEVLKEDMDHPTFSVRRAVRNALGNLGYPLETA